MATSDRASASDAGRIAALLRAGLDHYGDDNVEAAIEAWRAVLELDPDSAEARDYLESAGGLAPETKSDGADAAFLRGLLENARELMADGELEAAFDLLSNVNATGPPMLELEATVELIRSQLARHYRRTIGDPAAIPVVRASAGSLTGFNLPPEAGFLLSLVDGATPVRDMISLTGMDAFEALRLVRGLVDAKIVELA